MGNIGSKRTVANSGAGSSEKLLYERREYLTVASGVTAYGIRVFQD